MKDVRLVVCCSEEAASLRSELDQAVAAIKAMDDVEAIQWVEVGELRRLSPMVRQTAQVTEEAVRRFITQCC